MFKKLLLKKLSSLSPEEKESVREYLEVDKTKSVKDEKELKDDVKVDDEELSEGKKEEGEKTMADEKEKSTEELEEKKVDETTESADTSKAQGDVEEKVEEKTEEVEEKEEGKEAEEFSRSAEGIDIKDIVTRDEMMAKFEAFEAKYDAVVKENQDLKSRLSQMEDKYEKNDFGNLSKKGVDVQNKTANDTFESYSKQFM